MKHIVPAFLVLLLSTQCSKNEEKEPVVKTEYELVWADEFDGTGSPDASKWGYENGFIRNEEEQYYTNRTENARQEDGFLILEAHREEIENEAFASEEDPNWKFNRETAKYTSASLTTRNIATWEYGKIEVKAKLPKGLGMWPAIWMLGNNISQVGWPACGEIDIMEHVGFEPTTIHGTVHTKAYNHVIQTQVGKTISLDDPYDEFHIYSMEWTADKIDILLDQKVYMTFNNEQKTTDEWPFDQKFFMILNVTVGGGWGGQQGIDDSIFPQRMTIDYVRVYQLK